LFIFQVSLRAIPEYIANVPLPVAKLLRFNYCQARSIESQWFGNWQWDICNVFWNGSKCDYLRQKVKIICLFFILRHLKTCLDAEVLLLLDLNKNKENDFSNEKDTIKYGQKLLRK